MAFNKITHKKLLSVKTFLTFSVGMILDSACVQASKTNEEVKLLEDQKTFQVCGRSFKLEVAKTNQERSRGLMFRKDVPKDKGMIFVFRNASPQSFWMKNVPISLDILFFDSKGKLLNSMPMHPESPMLQERFYKQYASQGASQFVVELRHGTLEEFQKANKLKDCTLSPLPNAVEGVDL